MSPLVIRTLAGMSLWVEWHVLGFEEREEGRWMGREGKNSETCMGLCRGVAGLYRGVAVFALEESTAGMHSHTYKHLKID